MSYCRYGPESDVYCYHTTTLPRSKSAYVTHVARMRTADDGEPDADLIGLPHDGETFVDESLGMFKERLLWLRKIGYLVPPSALDRIKREMAKAE